MREAAQFAAVLAVITLLVIAPEWWPRWADAFAAGGLYVFGFASGRWWVLDVFRRGARGEFDKR